MFSQYKDSLIEIQSGVDLRQETSVDEIHELRDLTNSIKMIAYSPHVRFLQFVTCLTPDLYAWKYEKKVQWDGDPGRHYMQDLDSPRWKVDVPPGTESCFYDENGAHIRTNQLIAIYDCPGGNALLPEQRFIFCTFVTIGNQVIRQIQWSQQHNDQGNTSYTVQVQNCDRLPDWAIKSITEDYAGINGRRFELPEALKILQNPNRGIDDLNRQAAEDFLSALENWLTRKTFPLLFQSGPVPQPDNTPKF